MASSSAAKEHLRSLDPTIWKACAGAFVQIPTINSRVYYFPQGHAEQSTCYPSSLSALATSKPVVVCRVLAVRFLANADTDEVFAKIRLHPLRRGGGGGCSTLHLVPESPSVAGIWRARRNLFGGDDGGGGEGEDSENDVVSFAKVLTPSDANNGGGFSVPRFCADSIFPPLNYDAEPPVQALSVTDVHGGVWEFRHIYRGTPRRHLLTTGWSKFVNHKKLIAGDSVVFMRRRSGEIFVGIRRASRATSVDCSRWSCGVAGGGGGALRLKMEDDNGGGKSEGFPRDGKGRVSAQSVAESVELAAQDLPFEIEYYPRAGAADFVVRAEVVEASFNIHWTAGMRVKMAMETEDSSRMTWFQGTVSAASVPGSAPWLGSPWRMLQVSWDEPEVLQNAKRVSPWQVEYVAPTPSFDTTFPPTKKFRLPQGPGMLTDRERELVFPIPGFTSPTMFSPSCLGYNSFPAGMQGARHDSLYVSSLPKLLTEKSPQMHAESIFGMSPRVRFLSTDLNIGSSQSGNLSSDSQDSVHSVELVGRRGCDTLQKVNVNSFQLFGKIIHMKQPDEGGFNGVSGAEDDGGSRMNLFDRLDVECQRASA